MRLDRLIIRPFKKANMINAASINSVTNTGIEPTWNLNTVNLLPNINVPVSRTKNGKSKKVYRLLYSHKKEMKRTKTTPIISVVR